MQDDITKMIKDLKIEAREFKLQIHSKLIDIRLDEYSKRLRWIPKGELLILERAIQIEKKQRGY